MYPLKLHGGIRGHQLPPLAPEAVTSGKAEDLPLSAAGNNWCLCH